MGCEISSLLFYDEPHEVKKSKFLTLLDDFCDKITLDVLGDVINNQRHFRKPMYVIARKQKYYWEIREKIF